MRVERESLWVRVLLARYGEREGVLRNVGSKGSVWWRDVCSMEDRSETGQAGWLAESFRKVVGSKQQTFFWKEMWVEGGKLCQRFPRLYNLSINKDAKVVDLGVLVEGKWRWSWAWRRELFQWELELVKELEGVIGE